uniref:Uncharacterized protein n=2 Tax=Meloidogyne TaxID=189290 RepID=A0A914N0L3_MELIC
MPPKKKINSSRSIAMLGVAAVASRKVNNLDKYTLNVYNILTTRSGRNYEMEKMTGPKVKAVLKKQTSLPAKEVEINGNINNLKGKKKEENVGKNVKNAGKADKNNGKNIKNQGKNVNEQEENVKKQGTIVKEQGRSVRSTRATTRQNGQSTSNNNGNDETWEEEEKEKTPRGSHTKSLFLKIAIP